MPLQFQPMPLLKQGLPFNDQNYIFELKYDGFRALASVSSVNEDETILTVNEIASLLRCKPSSVYNLTRRRACEI